jgi:hypothetical protein
MSTKGQWGEVVDHVAGTGIMSWRFLEGAEERLPLLAETKANISVHIVLVARMEV